MIEIVHSLQLKSEDKKDTILRADFDTKMVIVESIDEYYNVYIPLKDFLEFADKLKSMLQ